MQIIRSPDTLRIDVRYMVPVNLPGYTVDLHFYPAPAAVVGGNRAAAHGSRPIHERIELVPKTAQTKREMKVRVPRNARLARFFLGRPAASCCLLGVRC